MHQDSGKCGAGNPGGYRKLVEDCSPVSLWQEQDTPSPQHIPIRKWLNPNGKKTEGQGTQCAYGHGLEPGQGLHPLDPAQALAVAAGI